MPRRRRSPTRPSERRIAAHADKRSGRESDVRHSRRGHARPARSAPPPAQQAPPHHSQFRRPAPRSLGPSGAQERAETRRAAAGHDAAASAPRASTARNTSGPSKCNWCGKRDGDNGQVPGPPCAHVIPSCGRRSNLPKPARRIGEDVDLTPRRDDLDRNAE
jgi:hypothetical protein